MKRVLMVAANEWAPWGGSEELWAATAIELRKRGIEVRVSVKWFGHEVARISELARAGCSIHYRRIRYLRPKLDILKQRVLGLAGADQFKNVDLVLISQGMNMDGLPWMRECARRRLPFAVIAHAAAESTWFHDRQAQELAHYYEEAVAAFFVSHANLELTRKQIGAPLAHGEIVRNPFNVAYNERVPWPQTDAVQHLRLACVGRLDPDSKGQDLILDVLRMPKWRARALTVSLVGAGRSESVLRRVAEMYQLGAVHFAGFANDIVEIWRSHHALLLPSRIEGLPLVAVEAMLVGRPVIATAVAGNAEIVIDGRTGFLAEAPTVAALDAAMERAWQERSQLKRMGEQAAEHIRRLIPPDPARLFADRLEAIVAAKR
jgi:glycosyltransferase involved in cell wall biosynthesis